MNFDLSPMQPAAPALTPFAALAGISSSDDFAALLDSKAVDGDAPELKTATGDAIPTAALQSPAAPEKVEPVSALAAIAKADALVSRLTPAPQAAEEPEKSAEPHPMSTAIIEPTRIRAQADLARSERKESRHDGRPVLDERSGETEADEAPQPAPWASTIAQTTVELIALPLAADLNAVAPPASPPLAKGELSINSQPRQGMASQTGTAQAPIGNNTTAHDPLPLVETPESLDDAITPVVLQKPVLVDEREIEGDESDQQELRNAAPSLLSSHGQLASGSKVAPLRATRIAEIAVGLADAKIDPAQLQVQASMPDPVTKVTHMGAAIAPADAPARGTVVERQLDLIRNEQWLGELAHDIASTTGNADRLSFRLMPHQLGRLDVDVSRSHNGLSLSIRTESDGATAILSSAQTRLADEIRAQGIKLADMQMFSGDTRQSPGQEGYTRQAPLIETFLSSNETVDVPEPEQRDGRYA